MLPPPMTSLAQSANYHLLRILFQLQPHHSPSFTLRATFPCVLFLQICCSAAFFTTHVWVIYLPLSFAHPSQVSRRDKKAEKGS